MPKSPVVLIVLDGWGYRAERDGNAIALAKTPTWDALIERYPHTLLDASGAAVGLPAGQMGNSEVGHLNIGAGRSEEHTSELQSHVNLVCRLLLEKKKEDLGQDMTDDVNVRAGLAVVRVAAARVVSL